VSAAGSVPAAGWHDVECGSYRADLGLWRELADAEGGTVLEVGAGSGRVALELAGAGHEVVALDRDAELLAVLRRRAEQRGLSVATLVADARRFDTGRRFALVIAPMQTLQLLGGAAGRARFLTRARAHLRPGGLLAAAVADAVQPWASGDSPPPAPDEGRVDGWLLQSQPVAIRALPEGMRIERIRRARSPDGVLRAEADAIVLEHVERDGLEAELHAAGLHPLPARSIAPTAEHVGSLVVLARA